MSLFMRVLIVLWVLALLLGGVFYFWDVIAGFGQQHWTLDAARQDTVNDSVKLLATVLGILATVGSLLKVVLDLERQ